MVKARNVKIKSMIFLSFVLILLASIKAFIGFYTNSYALISDAVQSSADLVVAIVSLIGLIIAARPPDKNFPYGYYKLENLITLLISLGLFYTVFNLVLGSISRFNETTLLNQPFLAMGTAVLSIVVQLFLGLYLLKVARVYNSPTIEANGKDKISDTLISSAVLLSLIMTYFKVPYFESIVTIFISLIIARLALSILKDSLLSILDVNDTKLQKEIADLISNIDEVLICTKLRVRKTGGYYVGDCEIVIEETLDVGAAHQIIELVTTSVKTTFPTVYSFVVEIEPSKKVMRNIALPIEHFVGFGNTEICHDIKDSPKILILKVNMENKQILKKEIVKNPFYDKTTKGLFNLVKLVERKKIDTFIVHEIGELSFNLIKAEKVEIFKINSSITESDKKFTLISVRDIIKKFYQGALKEIEEPSLIDSI